MEVNRMTTLYARFILRQIYEYIFYTRTNEVRVLESVGSLALANMDARVPFTILRATSVLIFKYTTNYEASIPV